MSAREAVLGKIRTSLKGGEGDEARRVRVAKRMEEAPRGVIPARGALPQDRRVTLFQELAEKANATVERVDGDEAVAKAVTQYLRGKNLAPEIRMGDDPRLAVVPWAREKTLTVNKGPSDGTDMVGVSHAVRAIAETGTLALTAGSGNPTTLNFLPEHHIVVVDAADIVGDLESVWDQVRATYGKSEMPRTVNLVTGPSRSADIEQTLLLGAHGPRSLHILIVE